MINPKAREWTFGPILKLLATLLALLVVLACVGSSGAPPASPTPPPGMFSTLPTTEPPVVGDQLPTIELTAPTSTPTFTQVATESPSPAPTFTPPPTYTPVPSPTPFPTATPYPTPDPTFTPQPTYTPVPIPTPYPTSTPYPTPPAPTFTPQPTYTPRPAPSPTPYPTATPYPTYTPQPTYTPEPTARPRPTNTPAPAAMPYFTRGSSQDEVVSVQGTPTEINTYRALGREDWFYGFSSVTFSLPDARVREWDNKGDLRVRLVPVQFHQIDYFTRGSSQDEVLSVQGTPTEINTYQALGREDWFYGSSSVTFSLPAARVREWDNKGDLKVRLVP